LGSARAVGDAAAASSPSDSRQSCRKLAPIMPRYVAAEEFVNIVLTHPSRRQ
jgi:hypothetical protein